MIFLLQEAAAGVFALAMACSAFLLAVSWVNSETEDYDQD